MHKPKFRILSIDGGGIRGIIPCMILRAIEKHTGKPIHELFDLIVGTSTGGIITLGLNAINPLSGKPYSAEEMLNLYVENGKNIFGKRESDFWSKLGKLVGGVVQDVTQYSYNEKELEDLLQQKFGRRKLSETLKPVLITSHNLKTGKPFYFSTRLAKMNFAAEDLFLWEVGRSTSAAPTYFNPSILRTDDLNQLALVDGGVFANNPAILAYAEAKELWKTKRIQLKEVGDIEMGENAVVTPDDDDLPFFMLSIGTGSAHTQINYEDFDKRKH